MARKDVDLWLILTDPQKARTYIANFQWSCPPNEIPKCIDLDSGRTIHFDSMSDEDAVVAATAILRDIEMPIIVMEKKFQMWEH